MARRKFPKRSRQRAKFHEIQQSFRQHACSLKRCQYDSKIDSISDQQRNSQELMLFESQHADLLHNNKLSPKIVSKSSRIKLETYRNDAKIGDDINTQATEQSKPESNLSTCDFKLNAESTNSFLSLENCPKHITTLITDDTLDLGDTLLSLNNEGNETVDEQSTVSVSGTKFYQSSSQSAMFRSNFKSQSLHDNASTYIDEIPRSNSDRKPEMNGQFPEKKSGQQENSLGSKTMENCRLVDKTLSMNDDLACEMNDYLDQRASTIIGHSILRPITILHGQHVSESTQFARSCKSDKWSRSADDMRLSFDEFQLVGTSTCEAIDKHDKLRNSLDKKNRNNLNDNKRFDVLFETIGKHLIMNWRELRKIFARLNKRIRENKDDTERDTVPLLSKWFTDDPRFSYISISTSSSFHTPPLSQRNANSCGNLANCDNVNSQFSLAQSNKQGLEKTEHMIRNSRFIASHNPHGSSSAKRCQTFENEYGKIERQSSTHMNIPFALSGKKKKSKKSFLLNQSISNETRRDSHSSELTFISDLDQFAVDCDSLQEIEYQDGTCKRRLLQSTTTLWNSQNYAESRKKSIPRTIITWVIALCIWLKKKLLRLSDYYKKLRQRFISSLSTSETKIERLIATFRIENEKMMYELSERVTRLSTDFHKARINTEATLNALTSEVKAVREVSKKINENNVTLMLEVKKLREILEKVQSKFSQPVSLPCSSLPLSSPRSFPPPPPLPPLLTFTPLPPAHLPPIASDNILKSTISVIPPPPPLPPVFLQSSGSSVQPTTPNSSRSKKCRTPTRKCSTPLLNRPSITVEDLLKVTLKKAPQSIKDNRRNTVPGPRGPVVSLEMLRNVQLKSTKRRYIDQAGRSPRSGRITKNRTTSNVSLSPILTGSEGNLERILRRVDSNRPRRLLSASTSLHDHDFAKETQSSQSLETLTHG